MTDLAALWRLVDRVRDRSYDWFTFAEKKRLHDLVARLKTRKSISIDDLRWLNEMDDALAGVGALAATFQRRRKGGVP